MGCEQVILHTEHTLGFLPRCVFCRLSVFLSSFDCPLVASLKSTSCLSKFAQTWREKLAKHSDLVHFLGKSFRLGEKIRLDESAYDATLDPKGTSRKARLKSAKNLYLSHRFFDKIRQIYRFFNAFRQKLQILCRNQARLIQTLQVSYFFRRDDLLATRHAPRAATFSPRATRTLRDQALIARRKTAILPAIFEQHLNKNFY